MTHMPANAKLCKMQQNTDRLVQLIGAATPNVPNQAPMPQASKQLLSACPIPPVHVIVRLLLGCESAILSSNEWHNDMNLAFISTIMAPNFEIKEITSGTKSPYPSQIKTSADVPGAKGQIHIMLPNISTAIVTL